MKRKRGFEASVSLFPFLDVLICTMGALILALVVAVLDAAASARREAQVAAAAGGPLDEQQADLALRIEQLDAQRTANLADLSAERKALAHIEAHLRSLREQLAAAEGEAENLARAASNALSDRALLEKRLAELAQEIKRLEALLQAQQRKVAAAAPAYSVVPYVGPNGTRRRPIYIECRGDRVILQPEGVELVADDFEGPLGPGNPLATAVRAASERAGSIEDGGAAPYPFLLVRPDGVEAYAAARAALKSWGSDFGYELIDQDWELALPARDPALAQRIETEVADARDRQRLLADSVPRLRGEGGSRPTFRADPVRGIVQVGSGSRRRGSPSNAGGFTTEEGQGGSGLESEGRAARPGGPGGTGTGAAGASALAQGAPRGASAQGGGFPSGDAAAEPGAGTSQGDSGPLLADARRGGSAPAAGDPSHRGTLSNKAPGEVAAELARERAADANGPGGAGSAGDSRLSRGGAHGAPGDATPAGSPGMAGGMPGGADQGTTPTGEGPKLGEYVERPPRGAEMSAGAGDHQAKPVKSLSEKRGRDWALPEQARTATPITRPIRLELRQETLRVLDDDGVTARKSIALDESTIDAVDDLVGAVWDAIRDWGIAGRGQYWRPVLVIDVAPGAERRYAELQGLLAESGLEVRPRLAEKPTPATR